VKTTRKGEGAFFQLPFKTKRFYHENEEISIKKKGKKKGEFKYQNLNCQSFD